MTDGRSGGRSLGALFRRYLWSRRGVVMPLPVMHPASPAFFHLLQTLLLFRCQNRSDLAVLLGNRFANATTSIASDLFELCARFVDDRRDLGHLFVGQTKLPLQTVLHRLCDKTVRMRREHEVMCHPRANENSGSATGNKNEDGAGD